MQLIVDFGNGQEDACVIVLSAAKIDKYLLFLTVSGEGSSAYPIPMFLLSTFGG
jgi:hypothetical protein